MVVDGYDVNLVIVVLWVIRLYCCMIHHMYFVLLIVLYYILLFVRLKVFCLLMSKKIPNSPAKSMRATLACRFTCVCIAHVL